MPIRPRSHSIETESRIAFELAIAPWVFRPFTPDYGIDGEVEVFNEDGRSSGSMFFVQLKGTDIEDLVDALVVNVSVDTFRYWKSLGLPVLLVRYHAPTKGIYYKWVHSIDPYYLKDNQKTMSIHVDKTSAWNKDAKGTIIQSLEWLRQVKTKALSIPLPISLHFADDEIHGVDFHKVDLAIRKASECLGELLVFGAGYGDNVPISVEISNEKIAVFIEEIPASTLHTRKGYQEKKVLENFPYDVLAIIGVGFFLQGCSNVASRILREVIPNTEVTRDPAIAFSAAACLAKEGLVDDALKIAESLMEEDSMLAVVQHFLIPTLSEAKSLSQEQVEYFNQICSLYIERVSEKVPSLLGTAYYNFGVFKKSIGDYFRAFGLYNKAAKSSPSYREREYFWRELAGILFSVNHFSWSAQCYQKALEIDNSSEVTALLADALMFSGEYGEAKACFDEYLSADHEDCHEWRLKAWALEYIIEKVEFDCQVRKRRAALEYAVVDPGLPLEQQLRIIKEQSLSHDALCGLAWFNLGVTFIQERVIKEAFSSFLIAAIVQPNDAEAWSNAFVLGINDMEFHSMLGSIFAVAYRFNKEEFIMELHKRIEQQPSGFPKIELFKIISDLMQSSPFKVSPFHMRILGIDDVYATIQIK